MINLLFSPCNLPRLAYAISNLCLYLIRNYKITNKVFDLVLSKFYWKKKFIRSDQVKYCYVPLEC